MAAFPSVPVDVDFSSFRIKYSLDPVQTEMSGGNVRKRSRPGDTVALISQTLIMAASDWATVRTFYRDTIFNGSARFTQNVWDGAAFQTARTVQLMDTPEVTQYTPDQVTVSWNLRVYDLA
jgi:hypothetical protein